jgi:hypothetical protein
MALAYSLDNLSATIDNLNKTGTFVVTSGTLATAIPPATIGLYQLINKLISELVSIKNEGKAEEKKISALISGDPFTDIVSVDDTTLTFATREGTALSGRGNMVVTDSATAAARKNKPAVLLGGATSGNLSEDAVFEMLQRMLHVILQIRNNVTDSVGIELTTAANVDTALLATVPYSAT